MERLVGKDVTGLVRDRSLGWRYWPVLGRHFARALLPVAVVLASVVVAPPAWASHPFLHATLRESGARHWITVKTVTDGDQPKRMTLAAGGHRATARKLGGGHWIVRPNEPSRRKLIRTLRGRLNEDGVAALRATGHYQCHAFWRVRFRLRAFNAPARAHDLRAAACV